MEGSEGNAVEPSISKLQSGRAEASNHIVSMEGKL